MSTSNQVLIENVRAYWDRRPCNIRHSTAPVDSLYYSQEVTRRKHFVEPHIPPFACFERWGGKRVLEVGCGIGTAALQFAWHGAHVTAVDLSPQSLAIAMLRAESEQLGHRIKFVQADAERLSLAVPVEPYDLIYSFGVIHHTPDPRRALLEMRRYMNEESTLKLMIYHRISWKVAQILWWTRGWGIPDLKNLDERIAAHSEAQSGCPVTWTYTRESARQLLSGFRITEMHTDHIFSWSIPAYIRHQYVRAWPWRAVPGPLFRILEKLIGWHLLITAQIYHL